MTIETPTDEDFASDTVVGVERNIVDYLKEKMPTIMGNFLSAEQIENNNNTFCFRQSAGIDTIGDIGIIITVNGSNVVFTPQVFIDDPLMHGSWVSGNEATISIPSGSGGSSTPTEINNLLTDFENIPNGSIIFASYKNIVSGIGTSTYTSVCGIKINDDTLYGDIVVYTKAATASQTTLSVYKGNTLIIDPSDIVPVYSTNGVYLDIDNPDLTNTNSITISGTLSGYYI